MLTDKDYELAHGMAKDIAAGVNFAHSGGGYDKAKQLHELVNDIAIAEEYPCESNYNDNGCTPGIWTWFDPACRYNMDYPNFDKALEAKLPGFELTDPEECEDEDEDEDEDPTAPVTLDDCVEIFDALDDIYAEAIKIVHNWIDTVPEEHFAETMRNCW